VSQPELILKPGRERSVQRKHPWIFSGAIQKIQDNLQDGCTVKILASNGDFLAWGAYSSISQIRVRIWDWNQHVEIGSDFFRERINQAISLRQTMPFWGKTDSYRIIHAESDGIPGLVVDRYGDLLVVQLLSAGAEFWRKELVALLAELTGVQTIFERSDVDVRKLEGLPIYSGCLFGNLADSILQIYEGDTKFLVDIQNGHKTGFYLDQRQNRRILRDFAREADVLDCFCYSGGFTVNALTAGARSVIAVDSSSQSLTMAARNIELNQITSGNLRLVEADVFEKLREFRDRNQKFDLVILDPPRLAPTAAQVEKASRAYKDINLLALKLLRPGGTLFTFSCSGGVSLDLFQKIVAGAALDAGINARIVGMLHQDSDHPIALNFPEGQYLKGLVVNVST
jgi:23S rRNA (cytosine1962-C5)-methyltransferase